MRKIALLLCFALIFGALTGCESEEAYVPTGNALADATVETQETQPTAPGGLAAEEEIFSFAYYAQDGFNPYHCAGLTNRMFFSLLYQGLFTVDRENNVEPMLCKSYTMTEDMKSYTFKLEEAVYSDGSYLIAEDVVASLKAAQESDIYGGRFEHIVSIESLSASTVTVTADCAYENLPLLLDVPILKAEQVGDEIPAGTGPYQIVASAGGYALQRRSNWWCQADLPVTAASIPLWPASNAAQIRDWFEFDDLGVAYADPGAASYVDYRCDYEVWDCESGLFVYLGCNLASKVFSNDDVRSALTYAIDREKLVEECYNGFAQPATLAASPNSPYYDKGLAGTVDYDPDRLSQALEKNGLIGATVIFQVNKNDTVRMRAARLIAEMLTDCGLVIEWQDNSTSYYKNNLSTGNFDLYMGQTRLSANMDLSEFFMPYGFLSYGSMSNAACYSLCLDALENIGNYYNLHQMILKDGQLTPVLFRNYAVYMERGLMKNLRPSRDNVFWYSIGKNMTDALKNE